MIRRPLARGNPAGDRQQDDDQSQRDAEHRNGEPVHMAASTRVRAQQSVNFGLPQTKGQGGGGTETLPASKRATSFRGAAEGGELGMTGCCAFLSERFLERPRSPAA